MKEASADAVNNAAWNESLDEALIPFNRVGLAGNEFAYISDAVASGHISGDGKYSELCHRWLVERTGVAGALLTHSATGALEMSVILAGVGPGDEVILPSYTFCSTATAVVMRGAIPVFVDIRPDTLNLDEQLVESAVTDRTKAIMPVHYAGVGVDMDPILSIASDHGLRVIEDAAQGICASRNDRPLGSFGDFAAFSFHETKNVTAGEGGAILVRDRESFERAEIIRAKGTNRRQFFRGQVDKYTWVDVGSSYPCSEINAAFLWAQLENAETCTRARLDIWDRYHSAFAPLEQANLVRRPLIPEGVEHNAHMYYLILNSAAERDRALSELRECGIQAVFHYIPLHSAPAGIEHGRVHGSMTHTDDLSARIVRLPLWHTMPDQFIERVIRGVHELFPRA